jgi:hypothetical protein
MIIWFNLEISLNLKVEFYTVCIKQTSVQNQFSITNLGMKDQYKIRMKYSLPLSRAVSFKLYLKPF